jgi:hypothetical protein
LENVWRAVRGHIGRQWQLRRLQRAMPGRTGFGQQVIVSNSVSGSHTLLQDRGTHTVPDYKSCGTPIIPGHRCTFTCWYQSDVPVTLLFYDNSSATHTVTKWTESPANPPSPTWASISATETVPANFNTVFFGPHISKVCATGCMNGNNTATLIVDDCSAVDDTTGSTVVNTP